VIHAMQFEIEKAHHANCERRAAQQRLVAEAERLAAHETPPAGLRRRIMRIFADHSRAQVSAPLTRGVA
jgi:hypothetical protein